MLSLFSVSLVQANLSLELFENRIFVRGQSDFHLEFSVRKPNCSNCETLQNRGLTVVTKCRWAVDFYFILFLTFILTGRSLALILFKLFMYKTKYMMTTRFN